VSDCVGSGIPAGRPPPVPVITDPLFYALAVPVVVALGLSKGGFAGMGQIGTPLLALVMPPLEAAAVLLPIMIVQDGFAVWVYRKHGNRRILAIMLPGALAGIGIAYVLASYISDDAVRIFVGVITIAFVLYNFIGPKRVADEVRHDFGKSGLLPGIAGVIAGAASGFTSTLCQAGGPPYQIYVLAQRLKKDAFVSTNAIFFAAVNLLKVPPYVALNQFSAKGLMTSLVLLPLAIATNQLGFYLVRRVSQELFYKITMVLLFLVTLWLIKAGVDDLWRG
jgi:uncharacterized membrane protein YfcA